MNKSRAIILACAMAAAAVLAAPTALAGPLKVGAARLEITAMAYADGKVPPAKFGNDHLYLRAIVLDNGETRAVLVGADLSFIRPDEAYVMAAADIARELKVPQANIIVSATHTHSGVDNDWLVKNPKRLADALVQVAKDASTHLRPAKVGFGEGSLHLNTNRDAIDAKTRLWTQDPNPDGPSDKTLAVLAFFDDAGRPIAGLMNYSMHPINGYLSGFVSSDFAGAASLYVEGVFGGDTVMLYSQGAEGDQMPRHLRASTNVMAALTGVPRTGFEFTREEIETPLREGKIPRGKNDPAADDADKAWMNVQGALVGEEAIRVMSKEMGHLDGDARITARQMTLTCPGRDWQNSKGPRAGITPIYADGDEVKIRLGALNINDIALGSINAEAYSAIGSKMKAASPLRKTLLVGLANGRANSGYIPTDDAYGRQTFQVVSSRLKPGCAEQGIVHGIAGMIHDNMESPTRR